LASEFAVRYPTVDHELSTIDKFRLARAISPDSVQRPAKVSVGELPPAARGLLGQAKLAAIWTHQEAVRLTTELNSLRMKPGSSARDSAIERAEKKLQFLRERNPGIVL